MPPACSCVDRSIGASLLTSAKGEEPVHQGKFDQWVRNYCAAYAIACRRSRWIARLTSFQFICAQCRRCLVVTTKFCHGQRDASDPTNEPREVMNVMNNPSGDDPLITLAAVATMLAVSKRTVMRLVDEGDFAEPYRISKTALRWRKSAVLNWLESRRAPQGAGK